MDLDAAPYGGSRFPVEASMGDRVGQCIEATFRRRGTHPVPSSLGPPPQAWAGPFAEVAGNCGLSQDLVAGFSHVAEFIARLPGHRLA